MFVVEFVHDNEVRMKTVRSSGCLACNAWLYHSMALAIINCSFDSGCIVSSQGVRASVFLILKCVIVKKILDVKKNLSAPRKVNKSLDFGMISIMIS